MESGTPYPNTNDNPKHIQGSNIPNQPSIALNRNVFICIIIPYFLAIISLPFLYADGNTLLTSAM